MFKRVAIMLFCLLMIFVATFGFVVGVVSVPTIYSYAEVVDDDSIYVPLRDPSDLVQSFQNYCKSRDLTIEGSIADAVTTFTTGAFNSACNTIGINIPQLQAEIKAEYDQSGKAIKFLYSATGIDAMNRIFAQFLQDNELVVGDEDVNKTVYSGRYFTDDQGNSCLCYIISSANTDIVSPSELGTPYQFDADYLKEHTDFSQTNSYQNIQYTFYVTKKTQTIGFLVEGKTQNVTDYKNILTYRNSGNKYTALGHYAIGFNTSNNNYYVGIYQYLSGSAAVNYYRPLFRLNTANVSPVTNIVIVSNIINNNTYEGDTIINNEGDVIVEPDPVSPGGNDPGWDIGGGGGTATDGNGNTWNIQFPDFQLPDLNIDWSINGLGQKFPFSIPFDLVALVTVLNAEPQAPRFEGTVNFGFTTWNYDINLQQFDSVAQACRIAELLLLVVGLILITRSIIKG